MGTFKSMYFLMKIKWSSIQYWTLTPSKILKNIKKFISNFGVFNLCTIFLYIHTTRKGIYKFRTLVLLLIIKNNSFDFGFRYWKFIIDNHNKFWCSRIDNLEISDFIFANFVDLINVNVMRFQFCTSNNINQCKLTVKSTNAESRLVVSLVPWAETSL